MCCKSFGVTKPILFKEWFTLVSKIFSTLSFVSETDSFAFRLLYQQLYLLNHLFWILTLPYFD